MGVTYGYLGLGLLLIGAPVYATDAARPLPPGEDRSMQQFAEANKACREWSDGCAVCLRHEDGSFACSLPGIACQPKNLACRPEPRDAH